MWIVGITGRSGSGKTMLTAHYAGLGYPTADGDRVSRDVTQPGSPCLAQLAEAFGADVLTQEGALNRAALAQRTFGDTKSTQRLIDITHPYIVKELLRLAGQARRAGHPLFFVDGAAIVGGPFQQHCQRLIVVTAVHRLAVSRAILRDGISKTALQRRLDTQLPNQALVAAADFVIENNASAQALYAKGDEVLRQLLKEVARAEA